MDDNLDELSTRFSLANAVDKNADYEAELQNVAKRTGVPVESVRAFPDDVKRQDRVQLLNYSQMRAQFPNTLQFLSDQQNANVAHDDIPMIQRAENLFGSAKRGWEKGTIQDELGALNYRALVGDIDPVSQARRDKLKGDMGYLDKQQDKADGAIDFFVNNTAYTARQLGSSIREGVKGAAYGATAGGVAGLIAGAIFPPSEALTAPAGFALGARAGAIANSVGYNYKMEAGFAYDEFSDLKDQSGQLLPQNVVRGGAVAVGLLNAALETTGEIAVMKLFPGADKILTLGPKEFVKQMLAKPTVAQALANAGAKWVKAAGAEGITEALQELSTIIGRDISESITGQQFAPADRGKDLERIGEAGAAAFAGTLGVGAPTVAYRGYRDTRQAQQVQQTQDFMTALGETATESKLQTRMPEKFQEFIAKVRANGPIENVYIPAEQFQQFFQSKNMDPAEVAAQSGAINYSEALAAGTDVVIPIEKYAATLAASKLHSELAPDIRLRPDDMTAREYAAYQEEKAKQEEELQKQLESMTDTADTSVAMQKIKDDVVGQLIQTGYERGNAEQSATAYAKVISTLAERAGVDPQELHDKYGLTVNRPLPEVLTNLSTTDMGLDPLLDRIRAGDVPTESQMFGPSLIQALKEAGGLQESGGELAARDVDKGLKPFERKLVQETGMTLDEAAEWASQRGFLKERDLDQLLEAIDNEMRGQPTYAMGNFNDQMVGLNQALNELGSYLQQLGLDPTQLDNQQIRDAIDAAMSNPDVMDEVGRLFQSDKIPEAEYRVLRREFDNLTPEEQTVFDEFINSRPDGQEILARLKELKGTPWAMQATEGIFVRQAIKTYAEGGTPNFQSMFDNNQVKKVRELVKTHGWDGLQIYLDASGFVGDAAKPINNVSSTFINCHPSPNCAKYCYATEGHYKYAPSVVKAELVSLAIEMDPVRAAKRTAAEYKATAEFANNKALRLFDKGDGNAAWLPYIKALNDEGVRVHIFSKVPEFLRQVPDMNLRLLSIDESNMAMADANPDLPVAFVYGGGQEQTDFMAKLISRDQIQVVLPIKIGRKVFDNAQTKKLKKDVPGIGKYICPIDGGVKQIGPNSDQNKWNCTKCDKNGGLGCYFGKVTKDVLESAEVKPLSSKEKAQRIIELRNQINGLNQGSRTDAGAGGTLADAGRTQSGGIQELLSEVDALLGDLLRDYEPDAETANALGGDGRAAAENSGVQEGQRSSQFRGIPINVLRQGNQSDNRGYIQFGPDRKFSIALLEKADLSTFLHETGHFYLEVLGDLAQSPDAPDQIKQDYQTIINWLGADSRENITTEMHEKFARANEAYLMEGNAPSVELRGAFQRFKAWLKLIYKQLSALNVELSPQVRGVFDRMYATDQEIQEAKREVDVRPLFMDAVDAGMSDTEFQLYAKGITEISANAQDILDAKLAMQIKREHEAWWKEARAAMRGQVETEVNAQPVYKAFDEMVKGDVEGINFRLNKQALIDRYGAEFVKRLPRSFQRIYTLSGGMDPDAAASYLGFDSGEALVQALVDMRPRKELIEAETDARMRETYGDMMTGNSISEEAKVALHNAKREEILRVELKALRRKQREVQPFVNLERQRVRQGLRQAFDIPPRQTFIDAAKGLIGQIAVKDLQPYKYLLADRKYAKLADQALKAQDFMAAADAKQKQILNHHLYLEATKARDEADAVLKYVQKFENKATRQTIGKAGHDYLDQIDDLMDRYEFRRVPLKTLERRQSLEAWANEQEAAGNEVAIDPILLDQARRVNYRQVSIDELRSVRDAIKNIEHLARLKTKLITKNMQAEFADAVSELVGAAANNFERKPLPLDMSAMTQREVAGDTVTRLDAMLLKMEQIVEWLDNGNVEGPWHTYLWNPIAQAQFDEYDRVKDVTAKIAESLEKMPKEQRESMLDTFEIPGMGRVTRKFIISIAMNMGNAQNIDKMMRGFGWNMSVIEAALGKLNAHDIEFVQETLDTINSLWPDIVALDKRMTGLEPQKVEGEAFEIKDEAGNVIGTVSGYYPLVYDPRKSEAGAKQEAGNLGQLFEEGYVRATTPKGHTQARTQGFAAPLLLDFEQVVTQHLTKVIKDLTHREAIVSANKILTNREIRSVLQETLGPAYEKQMLPWLRSVVNDRNGGSVQGLADFSRWMMTLRANVVAATMGFKATTAFMQITGLAQSLDKVKGRYLGQAMMDFLRHPVALTRQVRDLSGEMRHRSDTLDRDIRDQLRNLTGQNSTYSKAQKFAFYGIALADAMVSVPTWMGAYKQALDSGLSEKAARLEADAAVRLTQGSGGAKDLASIQRNNELAKLLTMFYSYFSVLYNRMRDMGRDVQEIRDMPRFLSRVFFTVMIPAVAGDLLVGRGPDDDEDYPEWLIRKMLLYPMMSIPLLRDIASSLDSGRDYKFSPVANGVEKITKLATRTDDVITGDMEWGNYALNAAEAFGYMFGVAGTAQMSASGKYLWRVYEGEEDPDNLAELIFYAGMGKRKEQ